MKPIRLFILLSLLCSLVLPSAIFAADNISKGELGDRIWTLILEHKPLETAPLLHVPHNLDSASYEDYYRSAIENIALWETHDGEKYVQTDYQRRKDVRIEKALKLAKKEKRRKVSLEEQLAFLIPDEPLERIVEVTQSQPVGSRKSMPLPNVSEAKTSLDVPSVKEPKELDQLVILEKLAKSDTSKEVKVQASIKEAAPVKKEVAKEEEGPSKIDDIVQEMKAFQLHEEGSIRYQTFETIEQDSQIDADFKEARDANIQRFPEKSAMTKTKASEKTVDTSKEILNRVIKSQYVNEKIDLDFDDITLSDLLNTIGETAQMNIVLDPSLKGNTLDLHIKSVSVQEALLLVANTYSLGFEQIGSSLFVTRQDRIASENLTSRIFKLKHINVEEAKELVDDLAEIVNASEALNSIMIVGQPEEIVAVEQILKEIDVPQLQVILEAKVIEMNRDALREVGIDWSDQLNIGYQEENRDADFDDEEIAPDSAYKVFQLARNPLQFETVIKMLESQNKARVLAKPSVTTMNDKEAEIFVGDEIPYTITNVTGGVVTTDVRWVKPGIRLNITPSIIDDDFVVIKVEPEVSFIFAFRGPNDEFPQIKTREATAHVRVENRQPFVIGGLLNQEDKESLFKIPFLGDIPLFGNLFSYESKTAVDTELIITIVPTIVRGK